MLLVVLVHALAAVLAPLVVRWLGSRAFPLLALVPAGVLVWALLQADVVLQGAAVSSVTGWVPALGLELALRMGLLQWLLVLVVSGVGALVLLYCGPYFAGSRAGLPVFGTAFLAFVGAMLGLVLADDLLVLYVFWELTTVCSYLLVGFDPTRRAARLAALQALLVTTLGGLVMLAGLLLLGREAGTMRISVVLADPPTSTATTVAVLLVLVGALSKSALVPLHFWLPGAMAAPTPVSAYLHAASMVKAGVYLVALLAPAFAGTPGWHLVLLVLGSATMLLGGARALRQLDLKLLLAYGTVSQLGFLVVLVGLGTRTAALAALAMLLAHAAFKASLFLVVGVIDHRTGTRDLRELSGLRHRMPVLAGAAALAGASMAGVPPTLGFVGKETVWAALLEVAHGDRAGIPPAAGWAVLVALVAGSALTAAYTLRFWWGAFGTRADADPTEVAPAPAAFAAVPVGLAALGLVLGFAGAPLTAALDGYAGTLPAGGTSEYLALWHGLGIPLALSGVALGLGAVGFALQDRWCRLAARLSPARDAAELYRLTLRGVDRGAVEVTGLVQRGSVPTYLAVVLLVVLALPGAAAVAALVGGGLPELTAWDTPAQAMVAVVTVLGAVTAARSRRRLRAVALAGVAGYGTGLLFLLHGAPDVALTQVLVETVSVVVLVLVLRRLPAFFSDRPLRRSRWWRIALGAGVGAGTVCFLLVSAGARTAAPVSEAFPEAAYEFGYGANVVNVTLVDIRAWDTMGEIAVLVAAATGVASLIFIDARTAGVRRVRDIPYPGDVRKLTSRPGRRAWLPGPRTLDPTRRSILFEVVTRLVFPSVIVFSVYLLIAGHNHPGGGFAAGMVAGLALMVRYLAGGRYELDEAAPIDAGVLIGTGLFLAALASLGPLVVGGQPQRTYDTYLYPPLLGEIHLVTSIGFDIGVYLVVIGLVLDVLRTFGSRLDRHILRAEREGRAPGEPGEAERSEQVAFR